MSALARVLNIAFIPDERGRQISCRDVSLRDLVPFIRAQHAPTKGDLGFLKLAGFGQVASPKGCLRTKANLLSLDGVEGDYDAQVIPMQTAAERMAVAGLGGLLYESPTSTADLPKWRVLCSFSHALTAESPELLGKLRAHHVGVLNAILGATADEPVLASESFRASQAFYFGRVDGTPDRAIIQVDGQFLDLLEGVEPVCCPGKGVALTLPKLPPGATPHEAAVAALAACQAVFADPALEQRPGGRHAAILDCTWTLAPFVRGGDLDEAEAVAAVSSMCEASGRVAHDGEVADAMAGCLPRAKPYEPADHDGADYDVLPPPEPGAPPDPGAPPPAEAEQRNLLVSERGVIKPLLHNAIVMLHHDAPKRIEYDVFHGRTTMDGHKITDSDISWLTAWLQRSACEVSSSITAEAINAVAHGPSRQVHPVQDYLAGLVWDGTPRMDTMLVDYFGAEDTPLNRAMGAKFLLSMVARAMKPGCQVDTVLILEGRQGLRKSTALSVLANGWFLNNLPELTNKDAALQLRGKWLIEFQELATLHRAEINRTKAFISTAVDTVRAPYGRIAEDVPRQCVFAGTVNPGGGGYLQDETGARRYWPVACGVGWDDDRKIDTDALIAVRDQLFAEAVTRFDAGEAWHLPPELEAAQTIVAAARFTDDAWTDRILAFAADESDVSVPQVLEQCLDIKPEHWNRAAEMRVAKTLKQAGWERRRVSVGDGLRSWRYFNPGRSNVVSLFGDTDLEALLG